MKDRVGNGMWVSTFDDAMKPKGVIELHSQKPNPGRVATIGKQKVETFQQI
jgi:hypothetical protein